MPQTYAATITLPKPLGKLTLVVADDKLIELHLAPRETGLPYPKGQALKTLKAALACLREYCRTGRVPERAYALLPQHAGFNSAVWRALRALKAGEVISYGGLAKAAGHPRAARAVGTVMARNPVPILDPCHRVVRSDGSIGNYGGGAAMKSALIEHERSKGQGNFR